MEERDNNASKTEELPEEEEEEDFNLEAGTGTQELGELLRSDAIGETMYDKKWVMEAVLKVAKKLDELEGEDADLEEETDADLSSLVDMSVEKDVCVFLAESGCLDLLRDKALLSPQFCDRSAELCLCLLTNATSREQLFPTLACDPKNMEASRRVLFSSSSAAVLEQVFLNLKTVLSGFSRLLQRTSEAGDEEQSQRVAEGALEVIRGSVCSSESVSRISFLLAASSNEELLEGMSKFLFSLFEFFMETEEGPPGGDFVKGEFVSALLEATDQSVRVEAEAASFHFVEVLGHLAALAEDEEELPESFSGACGAAVKYLNAFSDAAGGGGEGVSLSSASTVCKICFACWKSGARNDESFRALSALRDQLRDLGEEEDSARALVQSLSSRLQEYRDKHDLH